MISTEIRYVIGIIGYLLILAAAAEELHRTGMDDKSRAETAVDLLK